MADDRRDQGPGRPHRALVKKNQPRMKHGWNTDKEKRKQLRRWKRARALVPVSLPDGPSFLFIRVPSVFHPWLFFSQRRLLPRERHGRRPAVAVLALVLRPILEPGDEAAQLPDRLLVDLLPLLRRRELRLAEDARIGIGARPRDNRRRAGREQIHPVEGALLQVEADVAVLDLVPPHIVTV